MLLHIVVLDVSIFNDSVTDIGVPDVSVPGKDWLVRLAELSVVEMFGVIV